MTEKTTPLKLDHQAQKGVSRIRDILAGKSLKKETSVGRPSKHQGSIMEKELTLVGQRKEDELHKSQVGRSLSDMRLGIKCTVCGKTWNYDNQNEFTKDTNSATGFRNLCKKCKADNERARALERRTEDKTLLVALNFGKVPTGEGLDLLNAFRDEAKKEFRSLEQHLLYVLNCWFGRSTND